MSEKAQVLVVDDEPTIRNTLVHNLERSGYDCTTAGDGQAGLDALRLKDFEVALIDLKMPNVDGLDLLAAMQATDLTTVPIILTGYGDIPLTVQAMKQGAFDFIEKPATPEAIDCVIERAVLHRKALLKARAMAALAEQWKSIFDALTEMLIIVDLKGSILNCNRSVTARLGVSKEELLGRRCHEVLCGNAHRQAACPFEAAPQKHEDAPDAHIHTLGQGHFTIRSAPLEDSQGQRWGVIHIVRDVTLFMKSEEERNRMEVQLRHAQKMEAIGQLAAGIAHEINTPTQYVGDNTRFLQDSFSELTALIQKYHQLLLAVRQGQTNPGIVDELENASKGCDVEYLIEEIPKSIKQSLEGIERIAQIVRAMKDFSHPGGTEKSPVDLNKAINNTVTVCRNEWKYVAEMVTDLDAGLPLVPCLQGDFNQVILNLIVNAAHAMADGAGNQTSAKGTITIRTRRNGNWAEIEVADTGPGIPESIRHRVFEPFFTTKEAGKGTGQGLAIAHSVIVKKHGGQIDLRSKVGRGTTFTIRLPISPEDSECTVIT